MKLAPINNPHSKIGQVLKKSKREEKDEFIDKTKTQVIDKYGKKSLSNRFNQHKQNMTGSGTNFQEKDDNFKLQEKVTAKNQSIKLMQEGFLQAYVDFYYITSETTPSEIEPHISLKDDIKLNKRKKGKFQQSEESLLELSQKLVSAESYYREENIDQCLKQYTGVAEQFEALNDYETASYFYKKCLDVSSEAKSLRGEAKAYMGLGICEEKVLNIFHAMGNLVTALGKAEDGNHVKLEKEICKELVRVYQTIALQKQEQNDFQKALEFFEKCLDASQRAEDRPQEAECYQKIGHIYERQGDLVKAIEFLNKFLKISEETDEESKAAGRPSKRAEAHRQLAETHSKNGNVHAAIQHLESLLSIASEEKNKPAQADAFLKLGLLYYQENIIKKSVECLHRHFALARDDNNENETTKSQKLIDKARVNLGIAEANTMIENYKYLVLNDLNGLLDWKIRR